MKARATWPNTEIEKKTSYLSPHKPTLLWFLNMIESPVEVYTKVMVFGVD